MVYGISFSSIIRAWIDCERSKRSGNSCTKFRWHAARDLVELWQQMRNGQYRPKSSMVFMVTYPVLREVWAGAFRDRVVHHWEASRYNPLLEQFMVESGNNSMNCRRGFGSLRGVNTFRQMLYDFTDGYTRDDCYIVGGDFANYFMDIDKQLLWSFLEHIVMDEYTGDDKAALLCMMRATLFHRCQDDYYRHSPEYMWKDLPPHKSLFNSDGLPIGNLPSQLWANFLGASFMYWMMFIKGHKEFILFVDDWRVLVRSAEEGRRLIEEARQFLAEELHITLHPDKVYLQHWTKGTKLIGAVVKPHRIYISNRTRGNFIRKMQAYNKAATATNHAGRIAMLDKVRATVNSYLGLMIHYNTYKVRRRICLEHILPTWGEYLYFEDQFSRCVIKQQYNKLYVVRRRLKNSKYARKFIRPKWQGGDPEGLSGRSIL